MTHKVLIVTTVSGFLWQFEKNTVEILKSRNAQIHYASNFENPAYVFDQGYFEDKGIVTHPIPIQKSPYQIKENFRALKGLIKIIEKEEIDTLHCHTPVGAVLGRLAARLSKRKVTVIYTAHGFHFYKGAGLKNWLLYYQAERFLARYTDILVTINREDEKRARSFSLRDSGWVMKIPGVGVDREKFRVQFEKRQEARQALGLGSGELCLLTAALLDKEKNYQTVLKALEKLKDLPFRYYICGEGPYRQALEEQTARLGLEEKVIFLGFRKDLDFLLQGADIFLFPSVREGLGMAALEAMACGVPVIGADNRGTREYIRHGENGLLCPPRNAEDFATAIHILYKNPILRRKMAVKARKDSWRFGQEESRLYMEQVYKIAWKGDEENDFRTKDQRHHEPLQSPAFPLAEGSGGFHLGSEF